MSAYPPPIEDLPFFNPAVFTVLDIPLTVAEGEKYFLKYPQAQGTQGFTDINVGGIATIEDVKADSLEVAGNTEMTGTLDVSGNITGTTITEIDGRLDALEEEILEGVVHIAGDPETITGDKTFAGTTTFTGNVIADGITLTPTELSYVDGATSNIQTQLNTKASITYVDNEITDAINALIDGAPTTLDTLNELAEALGDDPNFATTIATQIGLKANDADVVHKTGNETITGAKTFMEKVKIYKDDYTSAGANALSLFSDEKYGFGIAVNTLKYLTHTNHKFYSGSTSTSDGTLKLSIENATTTLTNTSLVMKTNAGGLKLKGDDHLYIEFYPDNSTRRAYLGYPNAGSQQLWINNQYASDIVLQTSGSNKAVFGATTTTLTNDYNNIVGAISNNIGNDGEIAGFVNNIVTNGTNSRNIITAIGTGSNNVLTADSYNQLKIGSSEKLKTTATTTTLTNDTINIDGTTTKIQSGGSDKIVTDGTTTTLTNDDININGATTFSQDVKILTGGETSSYLRLEETNNYGGFLKYNGVGNNIELGSNNNSVEYTYLRGARDGQNLKLLTNDVTKYEQTTTTTTLTNNAINVDGNLDVTGTSNLDGLVTIGGNANGELLFMDAERDWLWKTDGTGAGTKLVLQDKGSNKNLEFRHTDDSAFVLFSFVNTNPNITMYSKLSTTLDVNFADKIVTNGTTTTLSSNDVVINKSGDCNLTIRSTSGNIPSLYFIRNSATYGADSQVDYRLYDTGGDFKIDSAYTGGIIRNWITLPSAIGTTKRMKLGDGSIAYDGLDLFCGTGTAKLKLEGTTTTLTNDTITTNAGAQIITAVGGTTEAYYKEIITDTYTVIANNLLNLKSVGSGIEITTEGGGSSNAFVIIGNALNEFQITNFLAILISASAVVLDAVINILFKIGGVVKIQIDNATTTLTNDTINLNGAIKENDKLIVFTNVYSVDLTYLPNTTFYPLVFTPINGIDVGDYPSTEFEIFGQSLGAGDAYNEQTFKGFIRNGGWTDHNIFYEFTSENYTVSEVRVPFVYGGTQNNVSFAIYVRCGYKYTIKTNGEWIGLDDNNGVIYDIGISNGNCVYPTLNISQAVIGSYSKTNISLISTVSSDTKQVSSDVDLGRGKIVTNGGTITLTNTNNTLTATTKNLIENNTATGIANEIISSSGRNVMTASANSNGHNYIYTNGSSGQNRLYATGSGGNNQIYASGVNVMNSGTSNALQINSVEKIKVENALTTLTNTTVNIASDDIRVNNVPMCNITLTGTNSTTGARNSLISWSGTIGATDRTESWTFPFNVKPYGGTISWDGDASITSVLYAHIGLYRYGSSTLIASATVNIGGAPPNNSSKFVFSYTSENSSLYAFGGNVAYTNTPTFTTTGSITVNNEVSFGFYFSQT